MRKDIFILVFLSILLSTSCEKEVDIQPGDGQERLVVEGYIEPELPPFVILTRSHSFFSDDQISTSGSIFVHGAEITVSDGINTVILQEVSTDTLPEPLVELVADFTGIDLATHSDPLGMHLTFYVSLEMLGKEGLTYFLNVKAEGKHLTSSTTIPPTNPLDSLWTVPHPENDTLVTLYARYTDPPAEKNFIRYFTSVNGEGFYTPAFNSVLDDRNLFNVDGKTFDFPLEKGHNRAEQFDFSTYTYFAKGDTISVRWAAIDEAHYNFWSTAEYDRNSTGNPFATPIIIKSNISGGLGIWGGYSPTYHTIVTE